MERVRAWEAAAAAAVGRRRGARAAAVQLLPAARALRASRGRVPRARRREPRGRGGRDRDRKLAVMRLSATVKRPRRPRASHPREAAAPRRPRRLPARVRALCTARKPIIGHNCLYDLLFSYAAFEGALPPTVAGWTGGAARSSARSVGPRVASARCRSASGEYDDTALKNLHARAPRALPPTEGCTFADGFGERYGNGKEACHEAAYDAWMTAVALGGEAPSRARCLPRRLLPDAGARAAALPTAADERRAGVRRPPPLARRRRPPTRSSPVLQASWPRTLGFRCGAVRRPSRTHPIAVIELRAGRISEGSRCSDAPPPRRSDEIGRRAPRAPCRAARRAHTRQRLDARPRRGRVRAAARTAAAAAPAAEAAPRRLHSVAGAGERACGLAQTARGRSRPGRRGRRRRRRHGAAAARRQASAAGRWAWLQAPTSTGETRARILTLRPLFPRSPWKQFYSPSRPLRAEDPRRARHDARTPLPHAHVLVASLFGEEGGGAAPTSLRCWKKETRQRRRATGASSRAAAAARSVIAG